MKKAFHEILNRKDKQRNTLDRLQGSLSPLLEEHTYKLPNQIYC